MCLTHSADAHLAPAVLQALRHLLSRAQHRWSPCRHGVPIPVVGGGGVWDETDKGSDCSGYKKGQLVEAERMAREEGTSEMRSYAMV